MKFSPAPWKVEVFKKCIEVSAYGVSLCEVAPYKESAIKSLVLERTGKANAQLISAAPEMYQALKKTLTCGIDSSVRQLVVDALAKAEGLA